MYSSRHVSLVLFAIIAFSPRSYPQTVSPGGIVNAAGFQTPVAPGSVIAIFGTNLAGTSASASTLPLPTTLAGVSVLINGQLTAPLFYVSAGQINAQLPYETPVGPATLTINGSAPAPFSVAASAPGILVYGNNRAVAVNQDYSLNAPDHPAVPGGWITVYLSGEGAVNPSVASGAASPSNPVAVPMLPVSATIGGAAADVLFAGLTPGGVGLFQVNLRIPALAGGDYPLIVTVGQTRSNAPLVAVSSDGRPISSIVRTIAYHQLTAVPDKGPDYRTSTAISGDGTLIAYTHDSGPNQIYTMNFDGSGQRLIDSYQAQCYCGSFVDVSDNGSKIVSTEGRQIRLVDRGAASGLLTVDTDVTGIKIEGDGRRVFFLLGRDGNIVNGTTYTPIQRGLYVINTDGSGIRQIVGPAAVASLFGSTADAHISPEFTVTSQAAIRNSLSVTQDGTRIVFGARKLAGNGPDAIFGVNLDGSGLHIVLGPVRYVGRVGISSNASKVFYDATLSGFTVETGVVNFDGTGQLALRHDGIGETPGVQLTADGARLLAYDLLYNTDGSGALQISAPLNSLTPGSPVMNSTATRFVYSFVAPGTYSQGLTQLASAEINPANLGSAPLLLNPSVNPAYAVAGGSVQGTVSVGVSPADHVIGVNYSIVRDGLLEDLVNGDIFLNDAGTSGDKVAGDGIFTSNNVVAKYNSPPGPRLLRLFAQVTDAAGLRHGTLIDLSPFAVVLQPNASRTPEPTTHLPLPAALPPLPPPSTPASATSRNPSADIRYRRHDSPDTQTRPRPPIKTQYSNLRLGEAPQ